MSNTFMSRLSDLLVTIIVYMPWLVMAAVATFIYLKRNNSKLILLQAAGAAGMFVLPLVQWVITLVMWMIGFSTDLYYAENIIYRFMLFMMLCVFAAGFCLEKLGKRTEVAGFPVQP
jgi:hypothetical protein